MAILFSQKKNHFTNWNKRNYEKIYHKGQNDIIGDVFIFCFLFVCIPTFVYNQMSLILKLDMKYGWYFIYVYGDKCLRFTK